MNRQHQILEGMKFNYLTVSHKSSSPGAWVCRCVCGKLTTVRAGKLADFEVKSCGCQKARLVASSKTKHGMAGTRVYSIWAGMLQRCQGKKSNTKRYKDKGIGVCAEWFDFEKFYADMGDPPEGCSIERVENSKGYTRSNCIWADNRTQSRTKHNSKYVEFKGELKLLVVWCEELHLNYQAVWRRLYRLHWTADRALSTPIAQRT